MRQARMQKCFTVYYVYATNEYLDDTSTPVVCPHIISHFSDSIVPLLTHYAPTLTIRTRRQSAEIDRTSLGPSRTWGSARSLQCQVRTTNRWDTSRDGLSLARKLGWRNFATTSMVSVESTLIYNRRLRALRAPSRDTWGLFGDSPDNRSTGDWSA